LQGLKCHPSRPPVPEERQINRLHAEKLKRRKDAAEAKAERKRKRKAKHDKACKLARAEGKPRPATPESSEEDEEEASDAEDHALGGDGAATGASSPLTYEWDADEGASAAPEETRAVAESSAGPSLEGAERESSPPAAGEETPAPQVLVRGDESAAGTEMPVLAAPSHQADLRGASSGQSSRGGAVPQAQRSTSRKRSMSARSG
jgi:hypothetical protein